MSLQSHRNPGKKTLLLAFVLTGAVVAFLVPRAAFAAAPASAPSHQLVPAELQPAFYAALARDTGLRHTLDDAGCASLRRQKLTACFDARGVHFTSANSPLALRLEAWGRVGSLESLRGVKPTIEGNRVSYGHENLTEWWRVLPVGFEQGFTIAERPAGQGELKLTLVADRPSVGAADNALAWGTLRYGKLVVTDATGAIVPATLESSSDRITISVNDTDATYPLTVDPLVWIEQEVTADDGGQGDLFGNAVAVDGTTALIASYCDPYNPDTGLCGPGAVYVFTLQNGKWAQTQKLVADDAADGASFGVAVAIDGKTAMISANTANVGFYFFEGQVYFFTKTNDTWTQTAKITPDPQNFFLFFGNRVALSGDTALVSSGGALQVGVGILPTFLYVFQRASDGSWAQKQKFPSPNQATSSQAASVNDNFGFAMSINKAGTEAAVGAFSANVGSSERQGNVTIYTESGGTWSQGATLTASDGAPDDLFGHAVAIQGDTLLVGAPQLTQTKDKPGKAYVFKRVGGAWTQTQEIAPADGAPDDQFGFSIALDGTRALISAKGAGSTYVFTNSNGTWSQTRELSPSDGAAQADFGGSTALFHETALVGAQNANVGQGTAYFYGLSNLALAVSAPQTVRPGEKYTAKVIATNSSSVASVAVSATITVPAAASFISATATHGSCREASGAVTCDFGPIKGNAGTVAANVSLKATDALGDTINNTANITHATPPLTASAPTRIALLAVDLGVSGSVSPTGTVNAGDNLAYTITVQNLPDAKGSATETQLIYEIPQGVNYLASIGASCAPLSASTGTRAAGIIAGTPISASVVGPAKVVCDLGTITPNTGKAMTITVQATAAASSISATFNAKAREPDSDPSNNTLTLATNPAVGPPGPPGTAGQPGPAGPRGPKGDKGSGSFGWLALAALLGLILAPAVVRRRRA